MGLWDWCFYSGISCSQAGDEVIGEPLKYRVIFQGLLGPDILAASTENHQRFLYTKVERFGNSMF